MSAEYITDAVRVRTLNSVIRPALPLFRSIEGVRIIDRDFDGAFARYHDGEHVRQESRGVHIQDVGALRHAIERESARGVALDRDATRLERYARTVDGSLVGSAEHRSHDARLTGDHVERVERRWKRHEFDGGFEPGVAENDSDAARSISEPDHTQRVRTTADSIETESPGVVGHAHRVVPLTRVETHERARQRTAGIPDDSGDRALRELGAQP